MVSASVACTGFSDVACLAVATRALGGLGRGGGTNRFCPTRGFGTVGFATNARRGVCSDGDNFSTRALGGSERGESKVVASSSAALVEHSFFGRLVRLGKLGGAEKLGRFVRLGKLGGGENFGSSGKLGRLGNLDVSACSSINFSGCSFSIARKC